MSKEEIKVKFAKATQEAFEVFADEVSAEAHDVKVTYHDKPIYGRPYIMVHYDAGTWDSWALSVDEGQYLCISGKNYWVEGDRV